MPNKTDLHIQISHTKLDVATAHSIFIFSSSCFNDLEISILINYCYNNWRGNSHHVTNKDLPLACNFQSKSLKKHHSLTIMVSTIVHLIKGRGKKKRKIHTVHANNGIVTILCLFLSFFSSFLMGMGWVVIIMKGPSSFLY